MLHFLPSAHRCVGALLVSMGLSAPVAAQTVYVGNFKDDSVSVVDVGRAAVVATVPVGAGPHGMAVSRDGRQVFVSADGASTVAVIDTAKNETTRQIEVGKTPHGLAIQPDGNALVVAVYGEDRIAWFDTRTLQETGRATVAKPHTVALTPDGRRAYVASQQPGQFALVVLDVATRTVVGRVPLTKPPRDLEFDPDGSALYFTIAGEDAVQVLDPATDRIVTTIASGASPHLATVFKGAASGLVVVQGPGTVMRFDAATKQPGASIKVGNQPHWMTAYDGGRAVAVTNEGSDSVSLVDLATGTVRTVPVGRAPRKVVALPTAAAATSDAGATVTIRNFAFAPAALVVPAGKPVAWTNVDGAPHGLRFADGHGGQDLLLPGQSTSRTFAAGGSYDYVCSVHPYMSGTVTVTTP
jgi:YVTN family beta-propeller protein